MKKTLIMTTAVSFMMIMLASCNANTKGELVNGINFNNISNDDPSIKKLLASDLSSSVNLINSQSLKSATFNSYKALADENNATDTTIDFNKLLNQVDDAFTNMDSFKIEETTSTNPDYSYALTISYKDLDNKDNTYSLLYNSKKEEVEIDEDEKETSVLIEGISIIDEVNYDFSLLTKTETEKDENESTVTFKLLKDEKNFIELKNSLEIEDNEKEIEYEYTSVKDGVIEFNYSLSFDNEEDKNEIELEYNGVEFEITSKEINQKTLIYVTYFDKTNKKEVTLVFEKVVSTVEGKEVVTYIPYVE